jgi:hypothetical protein
MRALEALIDARKVLGCGHLVGASETISRRNPPPTYKYRTTSLDYNIKTNSSNSYKSSQARAAPAASDHPRSKRQLLDPSIGGAYVGWVPSWLSMEHSSISIKRLLKEEI